MNTRLESAITTREVNFVGDGVRLFGEINYPSTPPPAEGYPLLFVLHNASYHTRASYTHYAELGTSQGYAVFRWDKRGSGRSGDAGRGSTTLDAVKAYAAALVQPNVNRAHAVILAQGNGTLMLGEAFAQFAQIERPRGVLLAGNMLDAQAILNVESRVQIIVGENDWTPWQTYGKAACEAHTRAHPHGAAYYVAVFADRDMMDTRRDSPTLYGIVADVMRDWLKSL